MNLAMSFALTSKKVILIDLDIRKGTLTSHVSGAANMACKGTLTDIEIDQYHLLAGQCKAHGEVHRHKGLARIRIGKLYGTVN